MCRWLLRRVGRFLVRDGWVDVCAAPVEPWQQGRLNEEPRHLPGQKGAEGWGHKRQLEHDSEPDSVLIR